MCCFYLFAKHRRLFRFCLWRWAHSASPRSFWLAARRLNYLTHTHRETPTHSQSSTYTSTWSLSGHHKLQVIVASGCETAPHSDSGRQAAPQVNARMLPRCPPRHEWAHTHFKTAFKIYHLSIQCCKLCIHYMCRAAACVIVVVIKTRRRQGSYGCSAMQGILCTFAGLLFIVCDDTIGSVRRFSLGNATSAIPYMHTLFVFLFLCCCCWTLFVIYIYIYMHSKKCSVLN